MNMAAKRQGRGRSSRISGNDITKRLSRKAEQKLEDARETIFNAQNSMRKFVASNPEKALLIAAGIGAAFGAVLTAFFRKTNRKAR